MRRRPGLKGRLDAVQGHAHETMDAAQASLRRIEAAVLGLIDELQDGITLQVQIGDKTLPVRVRILPEEESPGA